MKIYFIFSRGSIYPFLAIAVAKIVDRLRVPLFSNTEKVQRQEPVLGHDHEVDEETGGRLDHTDLTIRHRNKPVHRESDLDNPRRWMDFATRF